MMRTVAAAILMSAALAASAAAQPQRGAARGNDGMSLPEVIRTLDGYAIVQAQDALQLSDPQYGNFVVRLRRLQEIRRTHQQARNRILAELRRLTGPPERRGAGEADAAPRQVDEAAVREQLKALRAHDDQAAVALRKAYDDLDEVLDARQQARFRIFEEALERRKLDLIMRARQGAARGK